jgi:hypothetical protein
MSQHPVCQFCIHYYVTHEPETPYGCRAMHFKSAQNPARVVYASSGMECQLYVKKSNIDQKIENRTPKRTV